MTKPVQSRSNLIVLSIGSLVISLIFLAGMIKYVASWEIFYKNPVSVDSVVVSNDKQLGTRGSGMTYYPIVSYEYNGNEYTEKVYDGESKPIPEGSHISLIIDGGNPTKQLSKPNGMMLFVGITLTITFLALSIAAYIDSKKALN